MWACAGGHHECARALIEAGAAVDTVNNHGNTALMLACRLGHHECAQALIDAHADLELTNRDGQNALMIACESPPSNLTQSQRQGKIRCALTIFAATAPIEVTTFPIKRRHSSLPVKGFNSSRQCCFRHTSSRTRHSLHA